MPVSKAHANWNGDIPTGSGQFTAGGGSISGGVTYKSRFEDGPGANPEQLIAAAHATCFSMALASILAGAGFPAESVETDAAVTLRPVDGVDEPQFREYASQAKANCAVSRALAGVPEITLQATLAG